MLASTSIASGKRSSAFLEKIRLRLRKTSNDPDSPGVSVTLRIWS
jgi:hypothetical protein